MKRINPVVILLSLIGLASAALYFQGQHEESPDLGSLSSSTMATPQLSVDLSVIRPLPGYRDPRESMPPVKPDAAAAPGTSAEQNAGVESSNENANQQGFASNTTETESPISVRVSGLKKRPSNLYVAVFDSAEGFPKPEQSRTTATIPVDAESVEFSLSLPDTTTTGIAIFQDLNGDGKLTKNGFGLPVEPYGFSNNARSTFGPPSFSQAAFKVSEETSPIEITVR